WVSSSSGVHPSLDSLPSPPSTSFSYPSLLYSETPSRCCLPWTVVWSPSMPISRQSGGLSPLPVVVPSPLVVLPSLRDRLVPSALARQESVVLPVPPVPLVPPVPPVAMELPEEEDLPAHPESCPRSTLTRREAARCAHPAPSDPPDPPVHPDPQERREHPDSLDRTRSQDNLERTDPPALLDSLEPPVSPVSLVLLVAMEREEERDPPVLPDPLDQMEIVDIPEILDSPASLVSLERLVPSAPLVLPDSLDPLEHPECPVQLESLEWMPTTVPALPEDSRRCADHPNEKKKRRNKEFIS
ncbi:hypothetical protein PMAYCL1PPCAC_18725, partial [Pristionchus mayeri]